MDTVLGILIFIGIFVFIGYLQNAPAIAQRKKLQKKIAEPLRVCCQNDSITTDPGDTLDVCKVTVSGTCFVPSANYPCSLSLRVSDITDDAEEPFPVLSLIPEMADENGFLSMDREITMPYTLSEFEDLPVAALIPEAMILAKRGDRRLRVFVAVASETLDRVFGSGSKVFNLNQETYGYMEREERDLATDKLIARLAIAICAADGHVDKRETAVVRQYFSERFIADDPESEHKEAVSQALKESLVEVRNQQADVRKYISETCEQIAELQAPGVSQAAFELCVRIVAADRKVEDEERDALTQLARELDIPDKLAEEIRDRHLRISMYQEQSAEALLDMPTGLSPEEKIAFLNKEYQKWRSRVTHKDPKIRTEAELRVARITKLRRELSDAGE